MTIYLIIAIYRINTLLNKVPSNWLRLLLIMDCNYFSLSGWWLP